MLHYQGIQYLQEKENSNINEALSGNLLSSVQRMLLTISLVQMCPGKMMCDVSFGSPWLVWKVEHVEKEPLCQALLCINVEPEDFVLHSVTLLWWSFNETLKGHLDG